jgi:hypothetical protein
VITFGCDNSRRNLISRSADMSMPSFHAAEVLIFLMATRIPRQHTSYLCLIIAYSSCRSSSLCLCRQNIRKNGCNADRRTNLCRHWHRYPHRSWSPSSLEAVENQEPCAKKSRKVDPHLSLDAMFSLDARSMMYAFFTWGGLSRGECESNGQSFD